MNKTSFLTLICIKQSIVTAATLIGINAQPASALTLTLNDGNSSAVFDDQVGLTNWTVDGVNQVYQVSNFIRTGSDTQEFLVQPNPASFTQNGNNSASVVYNDPGFNYSVSLEYLLTGGANGSGAPTLTQTTTLANTSGSPLSLSLFTYNDLDVGGNFENDTATINPATFVAEQVDGINYLTISLDQTPTLVQVGADQPSAAILNSLVDSAITNLSPAFTSGAPLSDGRNFAYQFNVTNLADNGTFAVTQTQTSQQVPFEFSPTTGLLVLGTWFGGNALRKRLKKKV